jgi:hypothetical protein
MTPERWQRIEELYHAARTHPESERPQFLADACLGDTALQRDVEILLEQPGGGLFNDTGSTLTLERSEITKNHANGNPGVGGGVYNLGAFSVDALTDISANHASTSNDDIFP